MATNSITVTDRSRIECFEKCPRKRWYEYELAGRGIQPVKRFVALEAGGSVHIGLELMLQGKPLEMCVQQALNVYDAAVAASGIDMTLYEGQDPKRVVAEHRAIIEGLLRAFAATELQPFLAEFEVMATEQECQRDFEVAGRTLRLLARIDVLVRRRSDKALFVLNFKTASVLGKKWQQTMQHSMQVISEMLAAEATYGPIRGVLIYGLAKGMRSEYPKGSGNWSHNTPLAHGWFREGAPPMTQARWVPNYPGKGYRKLPVWPAEGGYPGGVRGWIDNLMVDDRATLEEQFVLLPPITRAADDIEEWQESVLTQELEIADAVEIIHKVPDMEQTRLNVDFPRHTSGGNCVWPSRCAMYECCWGAAGADPLGSGLYQLRQANHPAESSERGWDVEIIR